MSVGRYRHTPGRKIWYAAVMLSAGCTLPAPQAEPYATVPPLAAQQPQQPAVASSSTPRAAAADEQPGPVRLVSHEQSSGDLAFVTSAPGEPKLISGNQAPGALSRVEPAETILPPQSELADTGAKHATAEAYPIDLETAFLLAAGRNPQVSFARERWREAQARWEAAQVMWLPSLRAGVNYNKHEGVIQDVVGEALNTSRGAFYGGWGAGAVGAGSPAVPGISAQFHLVDALFQPLAARQAASARARGAAATTNDTLWDVSLSYLELMRALQDVVIAEQVLADARQLADLTATFARTGQGLQADADRAAAELMLRENEVLRATESVRVASARLAQFLRLDPTIELLPIEPAIAPIELAPMELGLHDLVAEGLSRRPELSEARALVGEAIYRMRRERYACLIPSVALGMSYGGFGAGLGSFISGPDDRMDFDAVAFWEVRNLGFGERAARSEANSLVRQANVRQVAMMDQVAREVTEAHAQVESRRQQIEIAQRGIEAATLSHDRNLQRIQDAVGLPIEALQSIQALATARRDYLRAVIDYNIAQFTLHRAIGWPGM